MPENIGLILIVLMALLSVGVIGLAVSLKGLKEQLRSGGDAEQQRQNARLAEEIKDRLVALDAAFNALSQNVPAELTRTRAENAQSLQASREELAHSFSRLQQDLNTAVETMAARQRTQLDDLAQAQARNRQDSSAAQSELRQTLETKLAALEKSDAESLDKIRATMEAKFSAQQAENSENFEKVRRTVEEKLTALQTANDRKLDEMRQTVDEKLHETISRRFSESFTLISERLSLVQQGLGEMTSLAADVGGLKKVLSNVKTRGTLGEVRMGAILEQILAREQYEEQFAVVPGGGARVDYAIKLPGSSSDGSPVFLPIDAKFPLEDFQRLQQAYEQGTDIEGASKAFVDAIRKNAKSISEKYICPPQTTDFALMFVPTEGLYAEILQRVGLFEQLQREYKITVVGPSNLSAFLSSLQMGFKTLAIAQRSGEVWDLLGAVKKEFEKFGGVLDSALKNLDAARNKFDDIGKRNRAIVSKLKNVETLPETPALLEIAAASEEED